MKKLLMALIFSVGLASSAWGQQNCAPADQVPLALEKSYGEILSAQGVVDPTHIVQLYRNPQTGSFSLVGVDITGVACMLAGGDYWEIVAPPEKKGNPA